MLSIRFPVAKPNIMPIVIPAPAPILVSEIKAKAIIKSIAAIFLKLISFIDMVPIPTINKHINNYILTISSIEKKCWVFISSMHFNV